MASTKHSTASTNAPSGTLAGQMAIIGPHANGFHVMRIALAIVVILYHTVVTSDGVWWDMTYWYGDFRGLLLAMLPMFFALSGFLVAGSLDRTPKLSQFLTLRVIRLVPALAVEVLLCALILGPLVTTLPLNEYFSDGGFWAYFRNIFGDVHFTLPGVFLDVPYPNVVNASLWTVPLELQGYGMLALMMILGLTKRRWILAALILGVCLLEPIRRFAINEPLIAVGPGEGWMLITCFFCGILVYLFRDKLTFSYWLGALAFVAAVACFHFRPTHYWGAPLIAYATVVMGLAKMPRIPVISNGDYSYGLYVFAFPIQQLFAHAFPHMREWYWNGLFTLTLGFAYAAFSWHCVENPVLKRKKVILAWVDRSMTSIKGALGRALGPLRALGRKTPESQPKRTPATRQS